MILLCGIIGVLHALELVLGLQLEEAAQCKSSSTTSLMAAYKLRTQYAPSVITCAFLCKNDPGCGHYVYANMQCSLYRSNVEVPVQSTSTNLICHRNRKVSDACPQYMYNNDFYCAPLEAEKTCVCVNRNLMVWGFASVTCQKYGMSLATVLSAAKHDHINALLAGYYQTATDTPQFWTSGKRSNTNPILREDFAWMNGIGSVVPVSTSFWETSKPDRQSDPDNCIHYKQKSKPSNWAWTLWDDSCTQKYKFICEFLF